MNDKPLVSCLMATYGRHSFVERALACWLFQDYHPDTEMIILNTHAVPLRCEAVDAMPGRLRIYNEPCHSTLGDQRNRLLSLASGDLIRSWDDDDIYLPWSISQGVQGILDNPGRAAWKPKQSWYSAGAGIAPELVENTLEPSITFRADIARKYRYFANASGDEHVGLIGGINLHEGGFVYGDVGVSTGFCCVYGAGTAPHVSGTLGEKTSATERAARWRAQQADVSREPLRPNWKAAEEWYSLLRKHGSVPPQG